MTSRLRIEGAKFVLDGEPAFLYGGELHYFRVDPAEWPGRLRQMRAAGLNSVSTYVPWMWHEPHPGAFDFTGQTHPRRNLEAFLRLCHEEGWLVFVRPGPYVMAELRNGGLPSWLTGSHPDIWAATAQGTVHPTHVVRTAALGGIMRGRRERVMKPRHTIQAVIRSGDESGYVAECVDFPVVTQGATVEESLNNLREAVGLMLDGEDLAAWNLAPHPSIVVMIELEPDYA